MALAISNIPVLRGEAAAVFIGRAESAFRNRGHIDFSRQRSDSRRFEAQNAERIAELKKTGKWPF